MDLNVIWLGNSMDRMNTKPEDGQSTSKRILCIDLSSSNGMLKDWAVKMVPTHKLGIMWYSPSIEFNEDKGTFVVAIQWRWRLIFREVLIKLRKSVHSDWLSSVLLYFPGNRWPVTQQLLLIKQQHKYTIMIRENVKLNYFGYIKVQ